MKDDVPKPHALDHSLFKFFGHNTTPKQNYGLQVLRNLALKVTPPIEFNDPYEFSPVLTVQGSDLDRAKKRVKEILSDNKFFEESRWLLPNCKNFQDFQKGVRANLSWVTERIAASEKISDREFEKSVLPLISKNFGLICFSADPLHMLMWSHYASAHTGLMLEFDRTCPLFNRLGFLKVDYKAERASFNPEHQRSRAEREAVVTRKSPVWAYEREFRIVVPLKETIEISNTGGQRMNVLKIDASWIKSVTLGARASSELETELRKIIGNPRFLHLQDNLFKMELGAHTFDLNRNNLNLPM